VDDTEKNSLWRVFAERNDLSSKQLEQFQLYAGMLREKNRDFNLTALTDLAAIIAYHFQDSLEIGRFIDIASYKLIADIGTGAGFPAIPLMILYPETSFVLIEVNQKKVGFLQEVVKVLKLTEPLYITEDWRTFLRHTALPIDLFLARASLQPEELLRIFKKQSPYRGAHLVYWASQHWQPKEEEKNYIAATDAYTVGNKNRRYIIFKQSGKESS